MRWQSANCWRIVASLSCAMSIGPRLPRRCLCSHAYRDIGGLTSLKPGTRVPLQRSDLGPKPVSALSKNSLDSVRCCLLRLRVDMRLLLLIAPAILLSLSMHAANADDAAAFY